jgi:phosphoribosylformylglycinamidine cyclo-ligase
VLPKGLGARIDLGTVPVLPVFRWLADAGGIAQNEMLRTFNCGVGMAAVVEPTKADALAELLRHEGEQVVRLGEIVAAQPNSPRVIYDGHLDLS